jgi:hypothetical protein
VNSGTIWDRFVEKTRGQKSRATVPLRGDGGKGFSKIGQGKWFSGLKENGGIGTLRSGHVTGGLEWASGQFRIFQNLKRCASVSGG